MLASFEWFAAEPGWLAVMVGCLALAVGSFLNVVILRVPVMLERQWRSDCAELAQSEPLPRSTEPGFGLIWPGSHCPSCGHRLRAWENVPILSYLLLRARCAACGARISVQYPLVEALTVLLSVAVVLRFDATWQMGAALLFTWVVIALAVIDLRTLLLPDSLTIPMVWLGLLVNTATGFTDLSSAVWGAVAGYLSLRIVFQVFKWLTGKEGMGFGDFKLLAMIGAWLGWQVLPVVILLASGVGAIVGIGLIAFRVNARGQPIPFGPFLAAAGWLALLYGVQMNAWYLQWVGLS